MRSRAILGSAVMPEWDEEHRLEFLVKELNSKRPLITSSFPAPGDLCDENRGDEVAEVLATFRMLAAEIKDTGEAESFGAYIISMASTPSDVLAVELLQKECRVLQPLRVVPLFERLEALQGAAACMEQLFSIDWYKTHVDGSQEVMIGYSDSAKDAGIFFGGLGVVSSPGRVGGDFRRTSHRPDLVPRSRRNRGAWRRSGTRGDFARNRRAR